MRTVRYIPGLDPDLTGATDSTHEMARLRRRACDKALSTMSCQLEADGHDTKHDKRVTLTLIITTAPVDYEYKTGDIALPSVWCGVVPTVVACGALRTVTVSRHSPRPRLSGTAPLTLRQGLPTEDVPVHATLQQPEPHGSKSYLYSRSI